MKKLFIFFVLLLVGGLGFYQYSKFDPNVFKTVFEKRLTQMTGMNVRVKDIHVYQDRNLVVLNRVSILDTALNEIIVLEEIKGEYDSEKYLEDEFYFKEMTIDGIELAFMERAKSIDNRNRTRPLIERYKEFLKVEEYMAAAEKRYSVVYLEREQILTAQMKTVEKCKQDVESQEASEEMKEKLEVCLKLANRMLTQFSERPYNDYELFPNKNVSILERPQFFVGEFLEDLIAPQLNDIGKNLTVNLRSVYKSQFSYAALDEKLNHVVVDKIKIYEKFRPDSQKVLVGFIENLSSKANDTSKPLNILVQGDFEKYNLRGINTKIKAFKEGNRVVTFNINVADAELENLIIPIDNDQYINVGKYQGEIKIGGIVHHGTTQGSMKFNIKDIQFERPLGIEESIDFVLSDFENQAKKKVLLLYKENKNREIFSTTEFGDQYLAETAAPSQNLLMAFLRDAHRSMLDKVKEFDFIAKYEQQIETLAPDIQKLKSSLELKLKQKMEN